MANQLDTYVNVTYGISVSYSGSKNTVAQWEDNDPNRPTNQELIDLAISLRALPDVIGVSLARQTITQNDLIVDLDATTPNFNNP